MGLNIFLRKIALIAFPIISASAFTHATPIAPTAYDISVQLYYSDISQPKVSLKTVSLTEVAQVSATKISKGSIDVEVVDTSLGSVDLARLATDKNPTLIETYALQVLYAAIRASEFYASLGFSLGPVHLRIQNPDTPPLATRVGNILSFAKFKSLEKVEGSSLNIRDITPMISEVVFHEMTHFAQGDQTKKLSDGLIGTTSYEGHANLMTYLISGRVDLGVLPGKEPGMRVLTQAKFGYQILSQMAPITYTDYEPFSSVLVKTHRLILSKAKSSQQKFEAHLAVSKVFMNIVLEADGSETFQSFSNKVIQQLKSLKLLSSQEILRIQKWFLEKGLDLNQSQHEGYVGALLINNRPPDRGDRWLRKETLASNNVSPTIEMQKDFVSLNKNLILPITAVLVTESSLAVVNELMTKKYEEILKTNSSPTSTQVQSIYIESLVEAAKNGVDLGGLIAQNAAFKIDDNTRLVNITATPSTSSQCFKGSVLIAPLALFDATGKNFAQISLPFICP